MNDWGNYAVLSMIFQALRRFLPLLRKSFSFGRKCGKMRQSALMHRVILVAISCLILALSSIGQTSRQPSFGSYPAAVEKKQARSINFKGDAAARTMRTRLSEALAGGVNFAGHYIVAGWGCGTGCISAAIIDARNGDVYWPLPLYALGVWYDGQNYADEPVSYRKNSHLLIITGSPGVKDNEKEKPNGKYYYEWRGNDLRLIKFVPLKSQ